MICIYRAHLKASIKISLLIIILKTKTNIVFQIKQANCCCQRSPSQLVAIIRYWVGEPWLGMSLTNHADSSGMHIYVANRGRRAFLIYMCGFIVNMLWLLRSRTTQGSSLHHKLIWFDHTDSFIRVQSWVTHVVLFYMCLSLESQRWSIILRFWFMCILPQVFG